MKRNIDKYNKMLDYCPKSDRHNMGMVVFSIFLILIQKKWAFFTIHTQLAISTQKHFSPGKSRFFGAPLASLLFACSAVLFVLYGRLSATKLLGGRSKNDTMQNTTSPKYNTMLDIFFAYNIFVMKRNIDKYITKC
jgi:hypothetical protein